MGTSQITKHFCNKIVFPKKNECAGCQPLGLATSLQSGLNWNSVFVLLVFVAMIWGLQATAVFFACWLVGICFAQWYPMGENTNVLWYVNVFMFYHGKYACLILWFRFVLQLFSGHVQTCALGRSRAEGCETCKHQEINRTWKHQNAKWAAIRIEMC